MGSLGDREMLVKKTNKQNTFDTIDSIVWLFGIKAALTDGCKDVGETEVVHSVKGQEVVEKLLLLIITAEEGVSFVQFSEKKK